MQSPKNYIRSGFTLIEMVVVIAVFSVVAAAGLVFSFDFYNSYVFGTEQNLVVGLLQKARSESVDNLQQQPHGLKIEPDNYVLFRASRMPPGSRAPTNHTQPPPPSAIPVWR